MNVLFPVIASFIAMFLGYRFYSNYLAKHVFRLDDANITPAVSMQDGMDYVPTRKSVVFSHHFASIAGLSPIVGPAIAVIWGWLPAVIWLVVGAVAMGAVHDFSALVVSIRHQGRSIGDVCEQLISKRARILFLLIIYIALALAMGAFASIVANLLQAHSDTFQTYPEASLPAILLIGVAVVFGVLMRKNIIGLLPVSIMGILLTFLFIWLGTLFPILFSKTTWVYLLLGYALTASVLPVWLLLQPRDFINTLSLYIGLGLLYFCVFFFAPTFSAPAINHGVENLPSMFPLLFVTIACGAVSGFHSVVSSGTTAKQLEKETDARAVGYGGMIAECCLGLIAVIACCAGVSADEWSAHYGQWSQGGLYGSITFFVIGGANFISKLGVPQELAATFVALLIVSFALTTLDSGTRLLRYNLEELGATFRIPGMNNRFLSSTLAVVTVWYFATSAFGANLWILFGTVNQLLAGLGLLAGTVYLLRLKRNIWVTALPMIFMLAVTLYAMTLNLQGYIAQGQTDRMIVGGIIMALAVGLILETIYFFYQWCSGNIKIENPSEESASKT
ncbi:MAG: carbon starvation protein A [Candidatus Hinthialibacter antarcticus]|nr:carbon starvation protein A [Candidatus Hinthialibacter antarcticus]